jgi:8-oxo-dGTP pyrophosphatase MutT (NUDIX family)
MSYITESMIAAMEEKYGRPRRMEMAVEISPAEFEMLRGSQKHGRNHDITLFIFEDRGYRRVAAIAKHFFPPGAYRAPRGAAGPGEGLEEGARREALEETGLEIVLDRFILRVDALFSCGRELEPWKSLVFTALARDGDLSPRDTEEIREARWLTLEELQGSVRRILLDTGMALFRYRVALHDAAVEEIERLRG